MTFREKKYFLCKSHEGRFGPWKFIDHFDELKQAVGKMMALVAKRKDLKASYVIFKKVDWKINEKE